MWWWGGVGGGVGGGQGAWTDSEEVSCNAGRRHKRCWPENYFCPDRPLHSRVGDRRVWQAAEEQRRALQFSSPAGCTPGTEPLAQRQAQRLSRRSLSSAHIKKALHCAWMLCQGRKSADLPAPQHHTHSTSAQKRKRRKNTSAESPSPPHGVPTCRRHAAGGAHPASATRRRQRRPSCGAADARAALVRPAAFTPPHTRSQLQASTWDYTNIQTAAQGRHSASGCAQISAQGSAPGAGRGAGSTHCLLRCSTAPSWRRSAAAAHLAALLGCTRELCWRKGSTAERRRDAAARRPCILLLISGVRRFAAGLQKTFPVVPAPGRDGRAQVSTFCRRTASSPPIRVGHPPFCCLEPGPYACQSNSADAWATPVRQHRGFKLFNPQTGSTG